MDPATLPQDMPVSSGPEDVVHDTASSNAAPMSDANVAPGGASVSSDSATPPQPSEGTAAPRRLQLIDEAQGFHAQEFQEHLRAWGMNQVGFGYDICAVLGSQSTGKSTLLNRLFGTNFDVMDDRARQQTTKGIWLCRSTERQVLVMDVEGTDGRERGEDQDFERKSSLFALTAAECLIVNMWENQVGLYQGANMGLLKTVLDVHLSLFQAARATATKAKDKTLLLFVIRDFIGTTPLANLESTVRADLQRIWAGLTKPEALASSELGDFFDVAFATLPHKVLQPSEFDQGVRALQRRFVDRDAEGYVFQTQYHKRIPIDGLPHYLASVWDQIVQNKDLDLPTQQELLAQFRCDEIAATATNVFTEATAALLPPLERGDVLPQLGDAMSARCREALEFFDKDASRYHQGVYARQRQVLQQKLHGALWPMAQRQLKNLEARLAAQFQQSLRDGVAQPSYQFGALVAEHEAVALRAMDAEIESLHISGATWTMDEERMQLQRELESLASALRDAETLKLGTRLEKEVRQQLAEPVELALSSAREDMWDDVLRTWVRVTNEATASYRARATSLGTDAESDERQVKALEHASWRWLLAKVQEQTSDAVLGMRLRGHFEDRFRYDGTGVPRVWTPSDDMDAVYVKARDAALALLPLYARITPNDPLLLAAAQKVSEPVPGANSVDDAPTWDEAQVVLSERRMAELAQRLRRDADAYYLEAKRSTVSSMSQVPMWMYVLLLFLGWNELMAVVRNPLYFTLLCLLLAGAYVTWRLNLSTPLLTVAAGVAREVRTVAEEQLRTYLQPPAAPRQESHELRERAASPPRAPSLPASFEPMSSRA